MTKQETRKECLKQRALLPNRTERDEIIRQQFLSSAFYQSAETIMTYVSYKSEPDTHALIRQMLRDGKKVCAPVCSENGLMESYAFSAFSELAVSKMGIPEPPEKHLVLPQSIDLIIVPGCAFQDKGFRLGYGGGYYDRYLPRTRAVTCGFFYEVLKRDFLPECTDVPLSCIITEKRIYHYI